MDYFMRGIAFSASSSQVNLEVALMSCLFPDIFIDAYMVPEGRVLDYSLSADFLT